MVSETPWKTVDVNDFYSGKALLTQQALMQGYAVNSYEYLNEPQLENAIGAEGLLTMLVYVLRCRQAASIIGALCAQAGCGSAVARQAEVLGTQRVADGAAAPRLAAPWSRE